MFDNICTLNMLVGRLFVQVSVFGRGNALRLYLVLVVVKKLANVDLLLDLFHQSFHKLKVNPSSSLWQGESLLVGDAVPE